MYHIILLVIISLINATTIGSLMPQKNPIGMRNCGSSCFMNSTLQALITMNRLTEYLISQENAFKAGSVSKALISIFELYNASNTTLDIEIMQPFYDKVTSTFFNNNVRQEDAVEFWDLLYEHLIGRDLQVNELDKIKIIAQIDQLIGIKEYKKLITPNGYITEEELIVSKLLVNLKSQDPSRKYINNIQEGIIQTLYEEINLDQYTRTPLGMYLIAALHIFEEDDYGNRIKNKERINLIEQIQLPTGSYDCLAIVCHQGDSFVAGHFATYVQRPSGWFFCNDSIVTPIGKFIPMLTDMRAKNYDPYLFVFGKTTQAQVQIPRSPQPKPLPSLLAKNEIEIFAMDLEILHSLLF